MLIFSHCCYLKSLLLPCCHCCYHEYCQHYFMLVHKAALLSLLIIMGKVCLYLLESLLFLHCTVVVTEETKFAVFCAQNLNLTYNINCGCCFCKIVRKCSIYVARDTLCTDNNSSIDCIIGLYAHSIIIVCR